MDSIEKISVQNQLLDVNSKLFNIFDEKNTGFANITDVITFLTGQFHYDKESVNKVMISSDILNTESDINPLIDIKQFNELIVKFLNNSIHLFWVSFENRNISDDYDKFSRFFGSPESIKERYGGTISFTYQKAELLIIKDYIETCKSYMNIYKTI
uniref:Uncharacterized protein n=1 Tax=viral metagenome TaxID=1070528 RepID=A0A6C0AUN7_9ZZZZ|tara:strand:- start:3425 stop:3892 length:468 start_codon:yes stop_codon:yes gene_type:complete